MASKGEIICEG